jgi:DMSO reductase family type II enzyme chaperone
MPHQAEILATARSNTYQFLALALSAPDTALFGQLNNLHPHLETSLEVLDDEECLAAAETVGTVLETLTFDDWHTSYLRCFGHTISKDCPPYETEYGQTHIFRKSQNLADIVGFYRAFGVDLAPDLNDRWDHVSVELEFMQLLCLKEAYALQQDHAPESCTLCRDAQVKFLDQHLGRWAPGFANRLGDKTGEGLYGGIAELLDEFLIGEMRRFDLHPETEMPPLLEQMLEETTADCQDCSLATSAETLEQGGSP